MSPDCLCAFLSTGSSPPGLSIELMIRFFPPEKTILIPVLVDYASKVFNMNKMEIIQNQFTVKQPQLNRMFLNL